MMYELFIDALRIAIEGLRRTPRMRTLLVSVSIALFLLTVVIWVGAPAFLNVESQFVVRQVAPGSLLVTGFLSLLALLSYSQIKINGRNLISFELDSLQQEREQLLKGISEKQAPDVLNTIRLNLNQLNEYYVINKSQARNSFRFSVFAVVAGLMTIIAGVLYFYRRTEPNVELTIISSATGALIQFIGAAYFYLYRKSLDQLNFFFGQLVRMQDTMLSIRLCDEIEDPGKKVQLREKIILELLARSAPTLASSSKEAAPPQEHKAPTT